MLAQLLLRFVLAGLFFFFFSVQSGLSLGLGDIKFSKLRQVYGQKELGALLKRTQARKENMDALERWFQEPKATMSGSRERNREKWSEEEDPVLLEKAEYM